jgi:hypothetical protein
MIWPLGVCLLLSYLPSYQHKMATKYSFKMVACLILVALFLRLVDAALSKPSVPQVEIKVSDHDASSINPLTTIKGSKFFYSNNGSQL